MVMNLTHKYVLAMLLLKSMQRTFISDNMKQNKSHNMYGGGRGEAPQAPALDLPLGTSSLTTPVV